VENLLLVEVRGDSMEPLIPNGSIVAVNLIVDQPPENGEFYVLHVEDELLVRRLELRLDGSLILHSENRRYAPDPIDRGRFKEVVLGKVEMWTVPRKQSKRTA
jgi:phage repressor protein C with HTH and peptisase S24 domain